MNLCDMVSLFLLSGLDSAESFVRPTENTPTFFLFNTPLLLTKNPLRISINTHVVLNKNKRGIN